MASFKLPAIVVENILPAVPYMKDVPEGPWWNKVCLERMKQLNHLHKLLYSRYDSIICSLYHRQKLAQDQTLAILSEALGSSTTAQRAAAGLQAWFQSFETLQDKSKRTVVYTGPVTVRSYDPATDKSLPTLVWQTAIYDKAACEYRWEQWGADMGRHEQALLHDQIDMYRAAIAAQQRIIPQLAMTITHRAVVNCVGKMLIRLKVPRAIYVKVCQQIMKSDCFWSEAFPEQWLEAAAAEPMQPNLKPECVIEEDTACNSSSGSSSSTTGSCNGGSCFVRCSKFAAAAGAAVTSLLVNRQAM